MFKVCFEVISVRILRYFNYGFIEIRNMGFGHKAIKRQKNETNIGYALAFRKLPNRKLDSLQVLFLCRCKCTIWTNICGHLTITTMFLLNMPFHN